MNGVAVRADNGSSDPTVFIFEIVRFCFSDCSLLDRMVIGVVRVLYMERNISDSVSVLVAVVADTSRSIQRGRENKRRLVLGYDMR